MLFSMWIIILSIKHKSRIGIFNQRQLLVFIINEEDSMWTIANSSERCSAMANDYQLAERLLIDYM